MHHTFMHARCGHLHSQNGVLHDISELDRISCLIDAVQGQQQTYVMIASSYLLVILLKVQRHRKTRNADH